MCTGPRAGWHLHLPSELVGREALRGRRSEYPRVMQTRGRLAPVSVGPLCGTEATLKVKYITVLKSDFLTEFSGRRSPLKIPAVEVVPTSTGKLRSAQRASYGFSGIVDRVIDRSLEPLAGAIGVVALEP